MVSMSVCVEDRIQTRDLFPDRLLTKIWCGVNEHAMSLVLNHDGRARAAVVRIIGCAYTAGAADCRHTHGCPAAQHGENCLHFFAIVGPAPGTLGPLAMAFVTSIQAIRNSNRTFCSKTCSRSERLPLVFSWIRLSESMVCRALTMSTFA